MQFSPQFYHVLRPGALAEAIFAAILQCSDAWGLFLRAWGLGRGNFHDNFAVF